MRDLDLQYTHQLAEDFWWFRGMRRITASWIGDLRPQTVLDAGCGTGFHLFWLRGRLGARRIAGIDISMTALQLARGRQAGAGLAQASIVDLPFAGGSFELITSFDVLSQVRLDLAPAALSEWHRVLRTGGHLFVRAPAGAWLRSSHDEELQTHTRFSRPQLCALLSGAGFDVLRSSYANFLLFPVAAARRLLKRTGLFAGSDVRPLPGALAFLEPLFLQALNLEARLLARDAFSFPFGLSLIALARKR